MGKWIWPEGLKPLWEDDTTVKEEAYRQGKELDDAIAKYYAENGGGDVVLDPDAQRELDERESALARDMASDYMARNRGSLLDKFMGSDLVAQALAGKKDPKEIREWAGKLLGLGKLKPSAIENAVAESLRGGRKTILDALPIEAKRQLYALAEREARRESELNTLAGRKSRETQGYNALLATAPLEDWEINDKMRSLESLMLANMAAGKGAVVPVYGSAGATVEIPGLAGTDMSSMDDKILMHMLGRFRTSGFLPEVQDIDKLDAHAATVGLDQSISSATGRDTVPYDHKTEADGKTSGKPDSGVIETTLYGPDKKSLKEYIKDKSEQWLADPLYKEAYASYFSVPQSFLPEDWEGGYPFVIYPLNGSSDLIVFDEDGSFPRVVTKDDADYGKLKKHVYIPPVSDSRMKKRKRKDMTNVGRLGSFLSSGMFRIGGE